MVGRCKCLEQQMHSGCNRVGAELTSPDAFLPFSSKAGLGVDFNTLENDHHPLSKAFLEIMAGGLSQGTSFAKLLFFMSIAFPILQHLRK